MGSFIEINDTLQITKAQGFPLELDYQKHLVKPYKAEDFKDQIFEFKDKPNIRIYQAPPIRCFLVENDDGNWRYWGLCQIIEVKHDYLKKTTSGKFVIKYIYSLEEMKMAKKMIEL